MTNKNDMTLTSVSSSGNSFIFWQILPEKRTVQVVEARFENNIWSKTQFPKEMHLLEGDSQAVYSPDGTKLFFSRALPNDKAKFNIWITEKTNEQWSDPKLVDNVNSESGEYPCAVTASGTLYFASKRSGHGLYDLYQSVFTNGKYSVPEQLGDIVNTSLSESSCAVDPEERYILFSRSDEQKNSELFVSYRQDGKWTSAEKLNIPSLKQFPFVEFPVISPDRKSLYFTSVTEPFILKIYKLDLEALQLRVSP